MLISMTKHKFLVAYRDNKGKLVGAQCARCKKIALHVDERLPKDILAEECNGEDATQLADRIDREPTPGR
jgi:hypothetical protein